jgi:hypothetical protein
MKTDFRVTAGRYCLVVLAALALSITLNAQVQNGQFQGTVLDQSGAAVPNATVTATNQGTDQKFTATTTSTGLYIIPQLPVGQYKVSVEAPGFKTVTAANQTANAGVIQRLDFKLAVGQRTETVEVTDIATQVNTEDAKLANTVGATQIANLPLNGRNVYDLIQLNAGAVNTRGVDFENGANTVVNGVRQNFNGFTINGVSNKGLSGGFVNQPIQDTVQEFQQLTLNNSAQYGNSAGSITNLVTKSGTNALHGSAFYFGRNDVFDANDFFTNQAGEDKPALRFHQFGATIGGPIIKDKLFFFGAYQADHFLTNSVPSPVSVEGPEWRAAIAAARPNSVAALLYNNFAPSIQGTFSQTLRDYAGDDFSFWLCPDNSNLAIAQQFAQLIGVDANDQAALTAAECGTILPIQTGLISKDIPFLYDTVSIFKQQDNTPLGNLFNGHEGSVRFDFNMSDRNRFFTQMNWTRQNDRFGPGLVDSARGFFNPIKNTFPNFQFNYIHTFNPKILNEFKAGYAGNIGLIRTNLPGVPQINFDDGTMGFGSYSGYPQFFKENIYTYSDVVSVNRGSQNMKIGAEFRRNIENSEFDVSRPSYYFFDQLFFAIDQPYGIAAGVDPGLVQSAANPIGPHPSNLATNIRHWRNWEYGFFFQDDYKVSRRLTLNLGLRYDLYQRHTELNDLATTFLKGPGTFTIDDITTGAGWVKNANIPFGLPGCDLPENLGNSVVAGACGPGGFAAAKELGKGDHNNFGPRVGFAWDMFGDGKTSFRASYGLSYEGTLYNPLSNSRWNPPYYSFNNANNFLIGEPGIVLYGPQTPGATPRFEGPPDPNNHQGPGGNSVGNISAWSPNNQNLANLTGIVLPEGIKDPYVHNYFLSLQHELVPKLVMEVDYVGTSGHKLFRAEDINRIPGGKLPEGECVTDTFGRRLCSQLNETQTNPITGLPINGTGALNPNYGTLRNWLNVVNSNYNSLQTSLKMQSIRGVTMNLNYTWSHAIDGGSTWHSGATTGNAQAAGEGFTTDQTLPGLDRGNSIYDVRHRIVFNHVWELPFFRNSDSAFLKNVLGGWQLNGIWSYQTGAHWSAFCRSAARRVALDANGQVKNEGCDFNLDGGRNDRPNAAAPTVEADHDMWANGWGDPFSLSGFGTALNPGDTFFTRPCAGCVGNLGRNVFVGPNYFGADISLFKNFKFTERVGLQFRAEGFNVFNRTNFLLPGSAGGTTTTKNRVNDASFGQAGGTYNPRQLQFGLKLNF